MLRYVGRGEREYGRRPVLPQQRKAWEFQFVFRGRCRPTTAERDFPSRRPRLHVMHPASRHGWTDEPDGVAEVLVFHFAGVPAAFAELVPVERGLIVPLTRGEVERFRKRGGAWLPLFARPGAWQDVRSQQLMLELVLFVVDRLGLTAAGEGDDDARRVTRSLAWFRENLTDSASVEGAARAVGCSASHLRRLYRQAGRPPPREALKAIRLETAAECLALGWPQKRVAEYLGFSEPSAFARAFRRHFGTAPGAYLRNAKFAGRP